jgi:hypothetical protein
MLDAEVLKANLQRELDILEETGQELWLQAALAESEVRTELHRLDQRFRVARAEVTRLGTQSSELREEIRKRLPRQIEELRQGYAWIAQHA